MMLDYDRQLAGALEQVMRDIPDAKPGKMFGMPAYKVGGKLAVGLYADTVTLKVGAVRAQTLIGKGGVSAFEPQPGRVWKDWIALKGDLKQHRALLEEAVRYVAANG
jgi:hypothetical protein